MGVKLSEWRLKISEAGSNALVKLNAMADKTSGKFDKLQKKLKLSPGSLSNLSDEIPGMARGLQLLTSGSTLAGAAIAGTGYLMYKSTKLAYDYDLGMAKINATAQLTAPELDQVKQQLIGIGKESGGNFERIPDAFEKINSQVNNVNKSMAILKVANATAKAGFVDIDLAASAVAQTLSIVGGKSDARGVADVLLKSKALGAGEFGDFAQYLPQLIAAGSNLSIGFKDTAGLFSFMTAKGQSAADSAMLIQNAFTALGKNDIIAGFKKGGINIFNKDGSLRALDAVFKDLSAKLKNMTAKSKSQFLESVGLRDAQAKNAFAVLAGDAEKLKEIMDGVRDSTGELNKQLDMTTNKARTWGDIGDKIKSWGLALGDWLLPIVDKMFRGAEELRRAVTGDHVYNDIRKLKADENLSRDYAEKQVRAKSPFLGPAMFENNGKALTGKDKELYNDSYKQMISKLTGQFDGDYKTWKASTLSELEKDKAKGKPDNTSYTKDKKSSLTDGLNNISGGGRTVKSVTVNFNKAFVEKFIVQAATVKESGPDITAQIQDFILRAINGAEMSVSNE